MADYTCEKNPVRGGGGTLRRRGFKHILDPGKECAEGKV